MASTAGRDLLAGHPRQGLASKFLAMISAFMRRRSRTKLAQTIFWSVEPVGAHGALDALGGGRLVRVGGAAHDVGDAHHLVDRRLDLVAGEVEFLQGVHPFEDRHQPDVVLQAAVDACRRRSTGIILPSSAVSMLRDVPVGGVVAAADLDLLGQIGDALGGLVEVLARCL